MLRTASSFEIEARNPVAGREDDPARLVAARLRRSGYPYFYGIRCHARDGVIVLSGRVPTFHLKQIAQSLAAHTPGVHQVENRLQVGSQAVSDSQS